jgi:hypothetical protein
LKPALMLLLVVPCGVSPIAPEMVTSSVLGSTSAVSVGFCSDAVSAGLVSRIHIRVSGQRHFCASSALRQQGGV